MYGKNNTSCTTVSTGPCWCFVADADGAQTQGARFGNITEAEGYRANVSDISVSDRGVEWGLGEGSIEKHTPSELRAYTYSQVHCSVLEIASQQDR